MWGIILLVVLAAGCGMLPRTERETAAHYAWVKRGTTVGELVRIYCREGSPREQRDMMDAMLENAHPSIITIACRP